MKIAATQLRRIIKEEVSKVLNEARRSPSVDDVVTQYLMNKRSWEFAKLDFEDMADGGDGEGIRNEYYPDWRDEDFQIVLARLG